MEKTMDKIIALAKARGFVYPGSEIYGGLANTWDYGNLGVELKNNVKRAWWQKFIQESPYNVGVDCAILMNPQTWVASGHLGSFSDPLMDCKECHERFRADKIIEDFSQENGIELESSVDGWSQEEMKNFIEEHNVKDMSTRQLKEAIRSSSEKKITESCIDYIRDSEEVEIDVNALKPIPNHEKYFFKRTGKDWIHFLNSVDKYGIYEPIVIARDNTIISGHDSTVATAMLVEYSSPVSSMADTKILPVKASDTVQKIRSQLAQSPARCLPVVDDDFKVIGIISESDLLHEANIQVILVDHNEPQQAVEGIENYIIQEIIDHHKINTFATRIPINFINKAVGSTSTIIANLYRENRISIPKDMASILLCGILSDTLILQSATTTEYDVLTAEYLSNITELDIKTLGNDIIKSGSHIDGRSAEEVVHQDMKEYSENKFKYSVSQIEVDSTREIVERKKEFIDCLEQERKSKGALFSALLVTDITKLSSIMFLASDPKFEAVINFPKRDEHIYYMKDIVSRKKQLIPLLSELTAKVN